MFSVILFFSLFRFISLLDDTASTIPTTKRIVFNFWVVHSTTNQVLNNFVGKGVRIYYRKVQPLFCCSGKRWSWNKWFFQAFVLLLVVFKLAQKVEGNSFIFLKRFSLYIWYEWIGEQGFDTDVKPYNKRNLQIKFIAKENLQRLLWL